MWSKTHVRLNYAQQKHLRRQWGKHKRWDTNSMAWWLNCDACDCIPGSRGSRSCPPAPHVESRPVLQQEWPSLHWVQPQLGLEVAPPQELALGEIFCPAWAAPMHCQQKGALLFPTHHHHCLHSSMHHVATAHSSGSNGWNGLQKHRLQCR